MNKVEREVSLLFIITYCNTVYFSDDYVAKVQIFTVDFLCIALTNLMFICLKER